LCLQDATTTASAAAPFPGSGVDWHSEWFAQLQNRQPAGRHENVWEPEFIREHKSEEVRQFTRASVAAGTTNGWSKIDLVYDAHDSGYYGEISFGTPPQTFKMALETWSDTVWIPNFQYGHVHGFYNHSKSSSYKPNGTRFDFGLNFLSGYLSEDVVHFGEFDINDQSFAEIKDIHNFPGFQDATFDGIFGLGFGSHRSPSQIKMPFHELVDSGVLNQPVFAFYLNKQAGGELTIGDINTSHYKGTLNYVPVIEKWRWSVKLDGVTVNKRDFTKAPKAVMASTLPLIWGPDAEVRELGKLVGVNDRQEIDCASAGPDIVFTIGGIEYVLTKTDYTRKVGSTCYWLFMGVLFPDPTWYLGTPFMQKYYSVFNWGNGDEGSSRIGFALRA
jgi:hypothetical protein